MKQQKHKKIHGKQLELVKAHLEPADKDAKTSAKNLLQCLPEDSPPYAPHNTTAYLIDLHQDAEEYTEENWGSMLLKSVC